MTATQNAAEPKIKPRLTNAFKRLMSVHWWMAGVYFILFAVGTVMSQLDRSVSFREVLYDFHKSLGVLSIALLAWRISVLLQVWWKKYTRRFPKFTPEWLLTTGFHGSFYAFMVAVPAAGFLLSNSFKANNVKFFGIPLPDVFPQNSALVDVGRNLHFWLSYTFLIFIALHITAQRKVVRANWRRFQSFMASKRQSLS